MISAEIRNKYCATIGIECHVQLKTATKLFSAVNNDARNAPPNTLISHIDLGMPGALPVLNKKAVEYAVRVAFAFNTEPQTYSIFERKHYFYPDLPKGYQITQLSKPIISGGTVEIEVDGHAKSIRLNRVQMEEDAGKSMHPAGKEYSLVDLNRAGTPLLEVVSEPDMHSPAEAKAYAQELYLLMRYADVSDANMYYGNMRFDVNVSVSTNPAKLGTRTETKNLNSFKAVERAVEYEISRQIEVLEKGGEIIQETMGWNDAKQKTFSQRTKEEAHDYRYFPDPDIPPLDLDKKFVDKIRHELPIMPAEWRKRLSRLSLSRSHIDSLLLAEVGDESISYLKILEARLEDEKRAKSIANWMINIEIPLDRTQSSEAALPDDLRASIYDALYELVDANKLSSTNAKLLLTQVLKNNMKIKDLGKYAEEQGFMQVSDTAEIEKIVAEVLQENSKAAEDVKNGEMKAIGFLVGKVMQKSLGKANPAVAKEIIKKQLGN